MDETQLRTVLADIVHTAVYQALDQILPQKIDEILERKLDGKLDSKLVGFFGEFSRRFDKMEQEMATKADVDKVYNAVDGLSKRFDTEEAERAAINNQLGRHNQWIGQLADATGTKLIPKHQS